MQSRDNGSTKAERNAYTIAVRSRTTAKGYKLAPACSRFKPEAADRLQSAQDREGFESTRRSQNNENRKTTLEHFDSIKTYERSVAKGLYTVSATGHWEKGVIAVGFG